MTRLIAALSISMAFVAACGGDATDYDCVSDCEAAASAIAAANGVDEATLCDSEAIQSASTCGECGAAFVSEFDFFSTKLGCGCPDDAPAGENFLKVNEDCSQEELPYTQANCDEFEDSSIENAEQCTETD